ncbi:MAG: hypothetical protein ACXWB2_15845 [Acidimicrobiales bacterium]
MSVHRTICPRAWTTAAAAAFIAGLASTTGVAAAQTPPASPSASVANATLTIRGTRLSDTIALRPDPANPNLLVVDFGAGGSSGTFDSTTFSAISAELGNGNDQFTVPRGSFADKPVTVDGGSGDDTIQTGDATDLILGGTGNDTLQGGGEDDVIVAGRGDDLVAGGIGHDTAFLGAGQDTFVWNPGEGSDFVSGDSGTDTLVFNGAPGAEQMSLSANGSRAVFLRDVGGVRMDLAAVEGLELRALGGADTVTVNDLSGTDVRQADIDLSAQGAGDAQTDQVIVNGTEQDDHVTVDASGQQVEVAGLRAVTDISGSETADQLQVNTRGGADTVDVSPAATALMGVDVDLGTGQP